MLDSIEVVALMRSDGRSRLLTLATDGAFRASCSAVESSDDAAQESVVMVRGGARLGSITEFALTASELRLRVGGTSTALEVVALDADAGAGSFAAVGDDGTTVDGAFRCT